MIYVSPPNNKNLEMCLIQPYVFHSAVEAITVVYVSLEHTKNHRKC